MSKTVLILALCAFTGTLNVRANVDDSLPFITGGFQALWGQFPSTVSIDSPFNLHCGGTVVDRQHIVTSAQCILNATNHLMNPFWVTVTAGDLNLIQPSIRRVTRTVTHAFVHQNFNPFTLLNDIAVLRLGELLPHPHNTIEPAIRNSRIIQDTTMCVFAGWGTPTAASSIINPAQGYVNSPIVNRDACNAQNMHNGRVAESMICAGATTGSVPIPGPCTGNLGGGLFCDGELTGILSFGVGCGAANTPGVYTQIRFFEQWIVQQFTRTDVPQPGTIPFQN